MTRLLQFLTLFLSALAASEFSANASPRWHGEYFPNVVLTDQDGRKHRFYDDIIKGKVVALNFIYTKCKEVCPSDTAQLLQVQDILGDRIGRDVFVYSITIDPANDTPAVLKRYKHMFGVGPGWQFLTGRIEDIDEIRRKLGLIGRRVPKLTEHSTTLILGNEVTAQWIKRTPFDHPQLLANLLGDTLHNYTKSNASSLQPFSVAPEIRGRSRGDILFQTRCAACHTIGGGDKLGPDLHGVAAGRPRPWLTRWLKEPDKMIAEKDPVAIALKKRYRNMDMPNLKLNDVDVAALIEYLETRDKALTSAPGTQASNSP
jgi:protein SCO1